MAYQARQHYLWIRPAIRLAFTFLPHPDPF
jgi:hypothetical protein